MRLFENNSVDQTGPAGHLQSGFDFLSRSSRPAAGKVRSLLEDWFRDYPDQHKWELSARFQADFNVGFHELWLHALLKSFNLVTEVHPDAPDQRTSHIDFRASEPTGTSTYLEATVLTDESDEERAKNRLLGALYDQVNKMQIQNYFLHIDEIRNPSKRQPSAARFTKFVSECIASVDYEEAIRLCELGATDKLPFWQYRQEDLEVDFSVIPVYHPERGIRDHQLIGTYPPQVRLGDSTIAIRHKISKKATKYGKLDFPLLIAINSISPWGSDRIAEIQALYGTEEFLIDPLHRSVEPRRKADGIWYGGRGPRNRTVSGIIFSYINPWNLPIARVCLYLNPWASHPYSGVLTKLPNAVVQDGEFKNVPGLSQAEVFSLQAGWPGQLFE